MNGSDEPIHNFTPRAQQVLAIARKEADRLNHNFVGTEHLLLGLLKLGQGTAVTVLQRMGVDLGKVETEVANRIKPGDQMMVGNVPYTPRVKKVLVLATKEARNMGHAFLGTEHLLLGLLREGDGVAHDVLVKLGVEPSKTRDMILRELDPNYGVGKGTMSYAATAPPNVALRQDTIDTSKRYDVYCAEGDKQVVYRNVLFKARRALLPRHTSDFLSEFLELQLENGKTIFVARAALLKFSEPETRSSKQS